MPDIPPVPKILDALLEPLRSDWIQGFLFTTEPIHVAYLNNSSTFFKRVVQSKLKITAHEIPPFLPHIQPQQPQQEPTSITNINSFFVPVISLNDFTIGVGAAYYDLKQRARAIQMDPFYNVRFAVNHKENYTYLIYQSVQDSQSDVKQTTIIYMKFTNSVKIEYVMHFEQTSFLDAVKNDPTLPVSKLLPHLIYFSKTNLNYTYKDLKFIEHIITQLQPSHPFDPFDDVPFMKSMCKLLGNTTGTCSEVIFQNAFPVFSSQVVCNNITQSVCEPSVLLELRDESLRSYALSIVASPYSDNPLLPNATTTPTKKSLSYYPQDQIDMNNANVNNEQNLEDNLFDASLLDRFLQTDQSTETSNESMMVGNTKEPNNFNIENGVQPTSANNNHNNSSNNSSNSTSNDVYRKDNDALSVRRQEMLRARRERNRAAARRSNERAKLERQKLVTNLETNKQRVETLKKREKELRAENLKLRKIVSFTNAAVQQ